MKKIYLTLAFACMVIMNVEAQQDPHYTQYMYNMNVMNPAYAGSKDGLSGSILYRAQWVNIDGAPKTGTLSLHSPVGKNVGLGLSVISDKIGPVEETNIYADFSYTIDLGGEHKLALGIKGGATLHKASLFSEVGNGYTTNPNDPAYSENFNNTYMNFGTGLFYYTDKYYAALSIPNMLKSKHLDVTQNGDVRNFGTEVQHYFLTAGYVFDVNENLKFKPSLMIKTAFEAPTSIDVSANFLLFDKFEAGATYRKDDALGAMVNFAVTPSIRIGYAYDHITSDLKVTTPATHEFMLLFDISSNKKVSVSPRFF